MKKLLAAALIGCMALSMTACGSDNGAAQTNESAGEADAAATGDNAADTADTA